MLADQHRGGAARLRSIGRADSLTPARLLPLSNGAERPKEEGEPDDPMCESDGRLR